MTQCNKESLLLLYIWLDKSISSYPQYHGMGIPICIYLFDNFSICWTADDDDDDDAYVEIDL